MTVNLEGRTGEKVGVLRDPAKVHGTGAEIRFQTLKKGRANLRRNQAFHLCITVRPIILRLLHTLRISFEPMSRNN